MEIISNTKITCPNCKHEFSLEDSLSRDYENEIKERYRKSWEKEQETLKAEKAALLKQAADIQAEKQNIAEQVNMMMQAEKVRITDDVRKRLEADLEAEMKIKNKELEDSQNKTRELLKQAAEFESLKRALQVEKDSMAFELEKKLNEERAKIQEQVLKQQHEIIEMKMAEKDKLITDLNRNIAEMQRKSQQGSMQTQGEVQELALELLLREHFPADEISEVGKGVEGADCILTVKDPMMQPCGTILFESKRTKTFSDKWIDKLKTDLRQSKAQAAVIVTQAMPKHMEHFGQIDGIWICRFSEVAGVTAVLRDAILKVNDVLKAQDNKGDKMTMLYTYLTGDEFKQQMEAIVEGFSNMKESIVKEQVYMGRIWAEREKQLQKVLLNTANFYGSVKGIAGNSIPDIKLLDGE